MEVVGPLAEIQDTWEAPGGDRGVGRWGRAQRDRHWGERLPRASPGLVAAPRPRCSSGGPGPASAALLSLADPPGHLRGASLLDTAGQTRDHCPQSVVTCPPQRPAWTVSLPRTTAPPCLFTPGRLTSDEPDFFCAEPEGRTAPFSLQMPRHFATVPGATPCPQSSHTVTRTPPWPSHHQELPPSHSTVNRSPRQADPCWAPGP